MAADLARANNRGKPLPPAEQVAVALVQLSGGSFQRVAGLACGQLSQNCARVRRQFITEIYIYLMLWLRRNSVLPVYQIITSQTVSLCVEQIHLILIQLRILIVEKLIRPKKVIVFKFFWVVFIRPDPKHCL